MADGFSCREQIGQATDRRALHLAEVLRLALEDEHGGAVPPRPEDAIARLRPPGLEGGSPAGAAAFVAALAGLGAAAWWLSAL